MGGFTVEQLEKMGVGALKKLCTAKGVLPAGAAEKADLVKVLKRFATAAASFSQADLASMPSKALRQLCAQKGILSAGMLERDDFLRALAPMATG